MEINEWVSTELGIQIWEKKYRNGNENFEKWLDRVSGGNQEVRKLIKEKKFLFGGRTLTNRGLNNGSCSNCYSSGYVEDNLVDIMNVNTKLALTYKAQGGQGVSLSHIRPKGSKIRNRYISDGIIPIMEEYDKTTSFVKQAGARKGALMISLDIKHKEAAEFITIKSDPNKLNNSNLSVEIDNEFMETVKESYQTGEDIPLEIHRKYDGGNDLVYVIYPIKLYKLLIKRAWESAEPGVIFTDRFRNYNLMEFCPEYQIETCNPCGEQPLPKDGACNLGSINLSEYVINPFTDNAIIDTVNLDLDVRTCIRALDEVIDENLDKHGIKEQSEISKKYRNVGLGIMGAADMLIKMGVKYGSEKSITCISQIMEIMFRAAIEESHQLAIENGPFPGYDPRMFDSNIIKNLGYDSFRKEGLRNCSLLSIAPTGSLGTMLNVSTGIEPNFAFKYNRKTVSLNSKETTYEVYADIAKKYVGKELPDYFVTAYDITWKDRINIQAAAQKYVDTAISATINLSKHISEEEIEDLYMYAWEQGLKGITIYREGCRDSILSTEVNSTMTKEDFFTRPEVLEANVVHFINDGKPWVAFIGVRMGKPFEIFTGPEDIELFPIPKSITCGEIIKVKIPGQSSRYDFSYTDSYGYQNTLGGLSRCFDKEYWNYARLVSGLMRQQVDPDSVIEIVEGMQFDNESLNSWKSGIIRSLKGFVPDGTKTKETCPECGGEIIYTGGCKQCSDCGWSKC